MLDFTGKCALVTGATGGIGRVVVKTLHDNGATVILTDMNQEALDAFAAELKERVFAFSCNLSDPADIDSLIAKAEKAAGAIDILINNAGLTKDNLFMRMKDEDWDLVLKVNLTAGFRLARAAIKGMMKRRYGRIVSMASIVGVTGNPGQANYSASKAGLIAMTKCLAAEVASRGITANCVAPGFIKTAMTDALPEEAKEKLTRNIPMARLGLPQDIAHAVAFLASDEASYITGQTIHVNGGMAMI